jgi:hypothetical protein
MPRIAVALLIALLVPAFAHAGSACCEFCADQYQQEGQFPYFEVIRTRRLIPDTSVATAEGWKRIFESCAQAERVNITASTDVAVVARAFLQLTDLSTPDIAVEYRWLLDDVPAGATLRSRTGDRFPHADDINLVVPYIAAGRHRIAIEARVIGEGRIDLRLLFITAQGFPLARFPADSRIDTHSRTIGGGWSLAGPALDLHSPEAARIYFQGYIEGSPADELDVRFVIDDVPQPPFHVVIPSGGGLALWDHAADPIAAGAHTVRLEARAAATSILTLQQVEAATAPVTLLNNTLPSLDATNSGSLGTEHQPLNCLIVSAGASGGTGGLGGRPACGKYDLLLDTELPAAPPLDDYTAFGDGYVEIDNRGDTSGIVTLTVEAIYEDSRATNCNLRWKRLTLHARRRIHAPRPTSRSSNLQCRRADRRNSSTSIRSGGAPRHRIEFASGRAPATVSAHRPSTWRTAAAGSGCNSCPPAPARAFRRATTAARRRRR